MKGEDVGDYGKSDPPTVEEEMGGPFTCHASNGTYTCQLVVGSATRPLMIPIFQMQSLLMQNVWLMHVKAQG